MKSISSFEQWYTEVQKIISQVNIILSKYDLTIEQFLLIEQIIDNQIETPSELARALKVSTPAVSRKLNVLLAKKFIYKEHDQTIDQRLVKIKITDKGKQCYLGVKNELEVANIV
ncbi:transcriptional regulator, SarA/Rot family [Latilactobacillus fragifolii]|uniref:transcriptional regulator, SarA/Rot family n=1 Tax=Latilactobacillus fragifolii TaxID=2814244 RepID=UPI001ABA4676|nr:MarR family transcriptional regulator [Latilactobacillus fragifolii]